MKLLTAFYDLEHGPVSFDFVTWLVRAMKERTDRRCDRLHVVIVPKEDGLGGFSRHWGKHDEHATRWRLWHICIAACPLAGATVTVAATREQAKAMRAGEFWWPEGKAHFMGPLVEAARKGETIPKLRATEAARRYVGQWVHGDRVVTLTLRQQDTDPSRNCNREAWERMDACLSAAGWRVLVLNEASIALGNGQGYGELDPDLRLALYERARMNLIGNNGPQELLKFSEAPYLAFGQALGGGWREHFKKYFSMDVGDQLPWARPDQRLVYAPDSFENLRAAFGG